jgi:Fe2+ transport system protein FeoA
VTLDTLAPGRLARVAGLHLDEPLLERLAALGLQAGSEVRVVQRLGRGGPLKLRVGRTEFVMRAAEAARIVVEAQE